MKTWLGTRKVAFLLAQASELPAPSADWESQARGKIFHDPVDSADLRTYVETVSFGKAQLVGDLYGPFQVTAKRPNGSWHIGGAMEQAVAAAKAGGQLEGVTYFCVMFTDLPDGIGAHAFWGGAEGASYVDMIMPLGVLAMENLHVLTEFADLYGIPDRPGAFDVMDCSCGTHPSIFTKLSFGWIDASTVATVPASSGTTSLTVHAVSQPLSEASTPGRVHGIRLPSAAASGYYLVEARLRTDRYEAATPNVSNGIPSEGVVVYWIDDTAWPPVHLKAVLTPGTEPFKDAKWGLEISLSAVVTAGFTVTVKRPLPAECEWIRNEIIGLITEIHGLQEELKLAPPSEKPALAAEIKRLQTQRGKLQQRAQQLGCPP
jgi:hypothetical protein